ISDTKMAFAAIAPDVNAEMSRMKPNATTTVSSIMPTRANNAALLRLMVEIIRPQLRSRQHLPGPKRTGSLTLPQLEAACPNSAVRENHGEHRNISIKRKAHTTCPHRRRIGFRED